MEVPRQDHSADPALDTGRVNQKRRTRAAIVDAAKELLAQGTTPTVAQAAEQALVSRTTAYRYFPTQDSLLLELSVHLDVDDIEELVGRPTAGPEDAAARAVEVLGLFNRHVLADEPRYRTAMRLYQDMWLAGTNEGDDAPIVREGRRVRWFTEMLEPLRARVGDDDFARLIAGVSCLAGAEAVVVLRDVCHLSADDAVAVTEWAAAALIRATLTE